MITPGDFIRSLAGAVGFSDSVKKMSPLKSSAATEDVSPLRGSGGKVDTYHRRVGESLVSLDDNSEHISSALPTLSKYLGLASGRNPDGGNLKMSA